MRRIAAVGGVVAALIVGACGGEKRPLVPTATVPQATTTTSPYAVPAVIDATYVNRVLAGLDQVVGDAVRLVVQTRLLDEEVFLRLKAVSVGDVFQLKLDGLQTDLLTGLTTYRDNPGNKMTTVTRLISADSSCIFAEVSKDFSAVSSTGDLSLSTQWVALVPLDITRDPSGFNATHWMFLYDGFRQDRSQPSNPCADAS